MRLTRNIKRLVRISALLLLVLLFLYCFMGKFVEDVSRNADLQQMVKRRFKEHYFNVIASDNLPLDRRLPELRPRNCIRKFNDAELPNTSIIVVFHNEANSTLLRTLVSVCNRTPARLIKEIILINDNSINWEHLRKESILRFASSLPVKVELVESSTRQGLMRARMIGAERATGQTLTFLDSHVEVAEGWLQPLMYEIQKNRSSVLCPVLSNIEHDTFHFSPGSITNWGGFNSLLSFRWFTTERRTNPSVDNKIWSPTMAGGIFSIDRDYFFELGGYDKGMNVWGFENIEMSLRIWTCGGQIIIHQCSHVGHVFRDQSPYTYPGGVSAVLNQNLRRTIDVWLDEYAEILYKLRPELKYAIIDKSLEERKLLRKRLQCKPFRWYLENVYPESPFPVDSNFYGMISNKILGKCLCSKNAEKEADTELYVCPCQKRAEQMVTITKDYRLKIGIHCITSNRRGSALKLCTENVKSNQKWDYEHQTNMLYNVGTGLCLSNELKLVNCKEDDNNLKWKLMKLTSTKF